MATAGSWWNERNTSAQTQYSPLQVSMATRVNSRFFRFSRVLFLFFILQIKGGKRTATYWRELNKVSHV